MMFAMPTARMEELFSSIAMEQALYAPIVDKNLRNYMRWTPQAQVDFTSSTTAESLKGSFFPQTEPLASFRVEGKTIDIREVEGQAEETVYFGVRACDVKGIEILDRVFLSDPVDGFYRDKREKSTLISMGCGRPEESCFCAAFGIDALHPEGDVSTWIVEDTLYWHSNTAKGQALTNRLQALFTPCSDEDMQNLEEQQHALRTLFARLPLQQYSFEGFFEKGMELFDSARWKELAKACLGCGTCTFVCPTCQCYDIRDFDGGHGVQRYRCWDSCMYSDFTRMAHGNPRTSQVERFRQRFMHKLVYFPQNNEGIYGCVGCGRCLQKCPVSMNIVKVAKGMEGEGV